MNKRIKTATLVWTDFGYYAWMECYFGNFRYWAKHRLIED
jgi:hypothetical protein